MKQQWSVQQRQLPVSTVFEIRHHMHLLDPHFPMNEVDFAELMVFNWKALDNLVMGRGYEEALAIVGNMLNLALLLAEKGIGHEYVDDINQALEAVFRAKVRGSKTDKWGFDGPGLAAVKAAYDVHEAQLGLATRNEIINAIAAIRQRIEQGHVFYQEPIKS
jgi:hypothetical protein